MKLSVSVTFEENLVEKMCRLRDLGFTSCQLDCWNTQKHNDESFELIRRAVKESGLEINAFWAGWAGPAKWDFTHGPATLGLVPSAYRAKRVDELISASEFAARLGIHNIVTHVGFLPENPNDPDYIGTIYAIEYLLKHLQPREQNFLFETGQETPVTLLRAIEDIGGKNVGVNLDTGNLILYGKGNPVDALDVFGKYVMNTHLKDGLYPTDGKGLGREMPIGKGKVDFPRLIKKLNEIGYNGPLTIEREITGDEQIKDIKESKAYIERLLNEIE